MHSFVHLPSFLSSSTSLQATKRDPFDVQQQSPKIVRQVLSRITGVANLVRPSKSIVLAFDGPAPYSKLRLQRLRRLASPPSEESSIDQLLITPGTQVMTQFTEAIIEQCAKRLSSLRYPHPTYFVSTSEFPGEGELKVFEWMSTFVKDPARESIVLCGDDSDFVLQCMAYTDFPNVRVLTSIPKEATANTTRDQESDPSSASTKRSPRFRIMDRQWLLEQIQAKVHVDSRVLCRDLVFLWALNGNDYLPKLRGLSFDALFDSYVRAMNSLPPPQRGLFPVGAAAAAAKDGNSLQPNWVATKALFEELAQQYQHFSRPTKTVNPVLVVEEAIRKGKIPPMIIDVCSRKAPNGSSARGGGSGHQFCAKYVAAGDHNTTLFESDWEASDQAARWKVAEEVIFASPDINAEYLKALHQAEVANRLLPTSTSTVPWEATSPQKLATYLSGILWMMKMYVDGKCPDTSFYYPWSAAPSPAEIARWIDRQLHQQNSSTGHGLSEIAAPTSDMPYLSPIAVAMTVQPWTNVTDERMLPAELRSTWLEVQAELFDHPLLNARDSPLGAVYKPPMPSLSYEDVIDRIDRIFQNASVSAPVKAKLSATSKVPYGPWYAVSRLHSLGAQFRMPRQPILDRVLQQGHRPVSVWHIPALARPYPAARSHKSFDPYASDERTRTAAAMPRVASSLSPSSSLSSTRPIAPRNRPRPLYAVRRSHAVRGA